MKYFGWCDGREGVKVKHSKVDPVGNRDKVMWIMFKQFIKCFSAVNRITLTGNKSGCSLLI